MRELEMVRNVLPRSGSFSVRVDGDQTSVRHHFVCMNCGHAVHGAVSRPPASCPTCQRLEWRMFVPPADRLRPEPGPHAVPVRRKS